MIQAYTHRKPIELDQPCGRGPLGHECVFPANHELHWNGSGDTWQAIDPEFYESAMILKTIGEIYLESVVPGNLNGFEAEAVGKIRAAVAYLTQANKKAVEDEDD